MAAVASLALGLFRDTVFAEESDTLELNTFSVTSDYESHRRVTAPFAPPTRLKPIPRNATSRSPFAWFLPWVQISGRLPANPTVDLLAFRRACENVTVTLVGNGGLNVISTQTQVPINNNQVTSSRGLFYSMNFINESNHE